MLKSLSLQQPESFNEKSNEFKKLFFALSFFHAVVLNRKRFGPIGWNIPYEFTDEDLLVSLKQIESILTEYKEIPYKVLNYICAELNYGGRVTDNKDLRLIKSLIENYLNPKMMKDGYKFS